MLFHEANRMKRLPPYLFTIMDELKREVTDRGGDVIDLGMGSPDQPTSMRVREPTRAFPPDLCTPRSVALGRQDSALPIDVTTEPPGLAWTW